MNSCRPCPHTKLSSDIAPQAFILTPLERDPLSLSCSTSPPAGPHIAKVSPGLAQGKAPHARPHPPPASVYTGWALLPGRQGGEKPIGARPLRHRSLGQALELGRTVRRALYSQMRDHSPSWVCPKCPDKENQRATPGRRVHLRDTRCDTVIKLRLTGCQRIVYSHSRHIKEGADETTKRANMHIKIKSSNSLTFKAKLRPGVSTKLLRESRDASQC